MMMMKTMMMLIICKGSKAKFKVLLNIFKKKFSALFVQALWDKSQILNIEPFVLIEN